MKPTRLLFRLLPTYLTIIVLVSVILLWFAFLGINRFNRSQTTERLVASTKLAREALYREDISEFNYETLCYELGSASGTRITLINKTGLVLGDTDESAASMELHADRPEFIEALAGEIGQSIRYSQTLHRDMLYVAVPVWNNNMVSMVIRSAVPLQSLRDAINPILSRLIVITILAIILSMMISVVVARRITRPIEEIRSGSELISKGEFQNIMAHSKISELDSLADSMNRMAAELQRRISMITNQRNEQQAVLSSMVEGVLAVDTAQKILRINQAAAALFECDPSEAIGQIVPEIIRHTQLQDFIGQLLVERSPAEQDILIVGLDERYIRASGAPMLNSDGSSFGIVVVLNDISRLKKLENLRQEFVGNVAHELKTPLTSIKGFVETLLGGALEKPDEARHFLDIIARQADRLNAILEDLLRLSKIERQREHSEIILETVKLRDIIYGSIRDCEMAAEVNSINVEMSCEDTIQVQADPILLRQAVTNLVDNAIKYSGQGTQVKITAGQTDDRIVLKVIDQGIGIADQHLSRLFERFYRVDKGRSRKAGGTGLGLAIVKHIVLAHNGLIEVESIPDVGSTFSVYLPLNDSV